MPHSFLPAATHNALVALARGLRAHVASPLRLIPGSSHRILAIDDAAEAPWITAKVTNSFETTGYDWVEVWNDPTTHTMVPKPGGRSGGPNNSATVPGAFEVNDHDVDGKVVRLWPDPLSGDYLYAYHRLPTPCTAIFSAGVGGCGLGTAITPIEGATLTLRDSLGTIILTTTGATTATTNSNGVAGTWDVTPGTSYTVTVDPPAGTPYYLSTTYSFTAKCGTNPSPEIRLPIADGYVCCPPCGAQAAGIPIPSVLTLAWSSTLGGGSTTITFTPSITVQGLTFTNVWYGQVSVPTVGHDHVLGTDTYGNPVCVDNGPQTVLIDFIFQCNPQKLTFWLPGICTYYLAADVNHLCPVISFSVSGDRHVFGGTPGPSATCDPPYFPITVLDNVFQTPDCLYPLQGGSGEVPPQTVSPLGSIFGKAPLVITIHA